MKEELAGIAKTVDKRLEYYIRGDPVLFEPMRYLVRAGGKRIRPALTILTCEACGGEKEHAIDFGCSVEFVHNFTLMHDDVMDNDRTRRGQPSVHVKFDVPSAINSGDGMFSVAFRCLAEAKVSPEKRADAFDVLSNAVLQISLGQAIDMAFEKKKDVTVREYKDMISKKTGSLLEAAVGLGMIAAGKRYKGLEEYGKNLGMAFQVRDDFLDMVAKPAMLGKPVGSDIREGKKSIVVLHGLEKMKGGDRKKFMKYLGNRTLGKDEVKAAVELLNKAGSLDYAINYTEGLVESAKKSLKRLPGSESKELLIQLADYVAKRQY